MKKVVRLTENDLVRLVKRVIKEQEETEPFYDSVSEFVGKEYEFTSKYKGLNGKTPPPIKGKILYIVRELSGSDNYCYIIWFTEKIVPKDVNNIEDKDYYDNKLIMDCNHGYFWEGCSCNEVGDQKHKMETEWYNDELLINLRRKVCMYS